MIYIPDISSVEGQSLTAQNWEEVGTSWVSCALDQLLVKPGLPILQEIDSLKHFLAWTQSLVLDARRLSFSDGIYTKRSPYDGSLVTLHQEDFVALVAQWTPDVVLLPSGFYRDEALWRSWIEQKIEPFFYWEEVPEHAVSVGRYFFADKPYAGPKEGAYALDVATRTEKDRFKGEGLRFMGSNQPVFDATLGNFYGAAHTETVRSAAMTHQHEPLQQDCLCPTCSQGFTRAYLHHLLENTPLLAKRLLMQHNLYLWHLRTE